MHRHFLAVVGNWKFENWHLYRYIRTHAVKHPNVTSMTWRRVL